MPLTTFTNSLRRSAVSGGNDRRMLLPSLLGLRPRSDWRMAFSMAAMAPLSYGVITSMRASGTREPGELLERDVGAVVLDRELLDQRRGGAAGADRAEVGPGVRSTARAIRSRASSSTIDAMSSLIGGRQGCRSPNQGTDSPLAGEDTPRDCPRCSASNTTIGRSLSMQNVMDVGSMTFRPRLSTSM